MANPAIFNLVRLMIVSLVLAAVGAPKALAAITCGDVASKLTPCINYVQYGGQVPGQCCTGIQSLNNAAKTTPDRQAVCRCLTSAVRGVPYTSFTSAWLLDFLPSAMSIFLTRSIPTPTATVLSIDGDEMQKVLCNIMCLRMKGFVEEVPLSASILIWEKPVLVFVMSVMPHLLFCTTSI